MWLLSQISLPLQRAGSDRTAASPIASVTDDRVTSHQFVRQNKAATDKTKPRPLR